MGMGEYPKRERPGKDEHERQRREHDARAPAACVYDTADRSSQHPALLLRNVALNRRS
jgi:hypothetical protein